MLRRIFEKEILSLLHNSNNKVIFTNSIGAFAAKGLSLIVSFFSVPAYISYFNNNVVLGIWYTILSVIVWVLSFDMGVGNGLRNLLVKAISVEDNSKARVIVSSGLFANGALTLLFSLIGCIIIFTINLQKLFNVPSGSISNRILVISVLLVFIAIMLKFFLTSFSAVFFAIQKSRLNDYIALSVSLLQLLFVLLFHFDSVEKALLILSASFIVTTNIPVLIAGIIVFRHRFKFCAPSIYCIKKDCVLSIITLGGEFFLCQVLYMIIMNTNEFFITYYYGAENTVEYTFYYKVFFIVSSFFIIGLTPVWSMVTKAYAEHQYHWLCKLFRGLNIVGLMGMLSMFLLIPFLQILLNVWLGDKAPLVDNSVSVAFAVFSSVFLYSSLISTITNGLARLKIQISCFFVGVLLKILVIKFIAPVSDSYVLVIWSNVLVLAPYCIIQFIDLHCFFNKLKYHN